MRNVYFKIKRRSKVTNDCLFFFQLIDGKRRNISISQLFHSKTLKFKYVTDKGSILEFRSANANFYIKFSFNFVQLFVFIYIVLLIDLGRIRSPLV